MRFADYEWLGHVNWEVMIECQKPINRYDVSPSERATHRIVVKRSHERVSLADAMKEAHVMAEAHEATTVGGVFAHRVTELGVFWHAKCTWDKQRIVGWNLEEFMSRLGEHAIQPYHEREGRVRAVLDGLVEAIREG